LVDVHDIYCVTNSCLNQPRLYPMPCLKPRFPSAFFVRFGIPYV